MILDLIFLGFTLLSAVLAMVRGFSREALSIASWVVSAVAAYYLYPSVVPYVLPHTQKFTSNPMAAIGVAAAIIFLIVLIIATIITMKIADAIIDSRVGALDRTLGFIFGAARGVLVMGVGYLFFTSLAGSQQPSWVTEAKSRPILESVARAVEGILPKDLDKYISTTPAGEGGAEQSDAPPADEPAPTPGQSNAPAAN